MFQFDVALKCLPSKYCANFGRLDRSPYIRVTAKEWERVAARVVYIRRNERFPVFLVVVFPKNQKENLSMAERNAFRKRADSIFGTYVR